jgi:hypothetical protein
MAGNKRQHGGAKGGGGGRRSHYFGVSWYKPGQKWVAQITVRGVNQYLGIFVDEADGACAYDAAVAAQNLHCPPNFLGDTGAEQAVKRRVDRSAIRSHGKSRFFGLSWKKRNKKWEARAKVKGTHRFLGYYDDETAAAWAFDDCVIANKIDTLLNFPSAPGAAGHRTTKKGRTSHYRGVCWHKSKKKWQAEIAFDGKRKSLGRFVDEDGAGRAYDAAIRKYYPDEKPRGWKRFNFPSADGDDGAGSARGASSSSAAVDARVEEEEERPRRRRRRDTRTLAEARADSEPFYACLRARYS